MSQSAGRKHLPQTQRQSIREWSDAKHDARYVTRRELKQFLTIYDKAAARIRGEETDRIEGVVLLTLQRVNEWNALPWWKRIFSKILVPVIVRPEPEEKGLHPDDAEQSLEEASGVADVPEEGGMAGVSHAPVIEQPKAQGMEMPWRCVDCGAEGKHLVAGNDLHPLTPTCPNCGSGATTFTGGPQ